MKSDTFKYFLLYSINSLKRNITQTIGLVNTISTTFFIVGLFLLYIMSLNKNSEIIFINNKGMITILKYIEVVAFGLLPLLSLPLIVNGVKMVVFSRSYEISIMRSIGATDWFIRWPFIIQGLVIGIIGAFAANIALFCAYGLIYTKAMDFLIKISFIHPIFIVKSMFLPFIIAGAFIGSIGSIIALKKVLNCSVFESELKS